MTTETLVRDRLAWLDDELQSLADQALLRRRLRDAVAEGPWLWLDGKPVVNFGSNDYLGLAGDRRLAEAAARVAATGAAASALLSGHRVEHAALEQALAHFEGTPAALAFGSGYAANVGAITALVGRGDAVFSDEKNHASLIDGARLSRADVQVYRHADVAHLAELLASAPARRRLIVTDSLFSMDGDVAPLVEIAELARQHDAMLLVDEAHATGVLGANGRGAAEQLGVDAQIDVRVGTLSKALGVVGGFVAGRQSLVDWLVNRARPYIFSTAMPPAMAAAAAAAVAIVADEPWRRERVCAIAEAVRGALRDQGWVIGDTRSQIIPLVVGDAERAVRLAERLLEAGLYVPAIRPPSVAPGASRLRLSLSAAHDDAMIARLVSALADLVRA